MKKYTKKTLGALLAGTMMLSALSGCGAEKAPGSAPADPAASQPESQAAASGEPVTLTYWQHSSAARDEMMTSLVERFEKENPDIKIKCEFIPEADYSQKLIPSLATDTAPDVFQVQSGMVPKLAGVGAIQPVDESVMPASMIEQDFVAAATDGLKYQGKYYGMPTDVQTIICFWNKTLAAEAGLDAEKGPQTWDECFDWARKMTKTGADGAMSQSGWGTKGYAPEVLSYVEQMGGRFFDEEKNQFVFADDPTSVEAISNWVSLYTKDKVYDTQFSKNWAGFRQGLVGMMLGHPAMLGNLPVTAPDLDFGVSLIPANGDSRASCLTSWGYVMSAKAPSEQATRFIEFLSSEAVEKEWTLKTGELPARKALLNDPEIMADPKTAVAINSLNDSFVGRLQTGALNDAWSEAYDKLMHTEEDIQTILSDCQAKMNEELANGL